MSGSLTAVAATERPARRRACSPSASRASSRSPSGPSSSSAAASARSSGRTARARATSPTRCAGRSASRAGRSGRARAEDVIWAGSEQRAAQGMADVTLVLDNADGLLPVDFQVLELGRRLYRSGENDYLLNKQRIRLRDLVDLLDAAHLADNAFLFIGQGMVDQALALRPEERRPLFEEVAGVRRHERRRRRAEDQLVESEANLARVEDILAELRPQARRLAAQAEQQATRETTGDELAASCSWERTPAGTRRPARVAEAAARPGGRPGDVDRAMADADRRRRRRRRRSRASSAHADVRGRERRDGARRGPCGARPRRSLREARLAGELAAIERDRRAARRASARRRGRARRQRRIVAEPGPGPRPRRSRRRWPRPSASSPTRSPSSPPWDGAGQAEGEAAAASGVPRRPGQAELETARRRAGGRDPSSRRGAGGRCDAVDAADSPQAEREAGRPARWLPRRSRPRPTVAGAARGGPRAPPRPPRPSRDRAAEAATAAPRARPAELAGALAGARRRGWPRTRPRPIAKAVRRVGGQRVDEDLVVDPALRAGGRDGPRRDRPGLPGGRGRPSRELGGDARHARRRGRRWSGPASARRRRRGRRACRRPRATALGGGAARRRGPDAIRSARPVAGSRRAAVGPGPGGAASSSSADLPAGWLVVARDGTAVAGPLDDRARAVRRERSSAGRRAETLAAEHERATAARAGGGRHRRGTATEAASAARRALDEARAAEDRRVRGTAARRGGRAGRRRAPSRPPAARPPGTTAQVERLDRRGGRGGRLRWPRWRPTANRARTPTATASTVDAAAVAAWERRAAELRTRRDRLAGGAGRAGPGPARRPRTGAPGPRRSPRSTKQRIAAADREVAALVEREHAPPGGARGRRARASRPRREREATARAALDEAQAADVTDRQRLAAAEAAAAEARERLRVRRDAVRGRPRSPTSRRGSASMRSARDSSSSWRPSASSGLGALAAG